MRSLTINPRRYFDEKSEQWKDATSFRVRDIPELIFALEQAYAHCLTTPLDQDDNPPEEDDQNVPYLFPTSLSDRPLRKQGAFFADAAIFCVYRKANLRPPSRRCTGTAV